MNFINNNTAIENNITTTPIICTTNNNNNCNIKIIKATSRKPIKSPIIINSIKKIGVGTKTSTQLADPSQSVQILVARKIVGGQSNINTRNQLNNNSLNNIITTTARPSGVIQKRCSDETIIVKNIPGEELEVENISSTAVTTAELIKKFRIPKGIALTPKFANDLVVGTTHIPDVATQASTALMSPPLTTTNDDADNSSNLVEYVEELYEDGEDEEEREEDMQVEEIEEINDSCDYEEYQETEEPEEGELEESDLIEEVESSEHQDLLMSGECEDFIETSNNNSNMLITTTPTCQSLTTTTTTTSPVPQIIQAVQPNGTVTCFQLPPNTIIIQSPDGALLATTAPHPTKQGQQQIIALQDLNSQISEALNLSTTNPTTVVSPATLQPSATVVLSPSDTVVPLVTTSGDSVAATASEIVHQSTNAAVTSSNESLIKAQQQQILA